MYKKMEEEIETLTQQVAEQANQRSDAQLLMTHPGVGASDGSGDRGIPR